MPPQPNAEGLEYQAVETFISKATKLAKNVNDKVKPYTPTRVQTLLENTGERVGEVIESETAQQYIKGADARLESYVIKPVADSPQFQEGKTKAIAKYTEATEKADQIYNITTSKVETARQGIETVRHQLGFVGSSITEACEGRKSEEEEEEESTTIRQRMEDKVSCLVNSAQTKYYKVLENADHGIEVYFPETVDEAAEAKAESVKALCYKAAKRITPTAAKRFQESKARTAEQLDKMIHVDLISYAADVIDVTAATTHEVAVKKPLALKAKAAEKFEESRTIAVAKYTAGKELATTKYTEKKELVVAKATEASDFTCEKATEAKALVYEKLRPVLESKYNKQLAEAYKVALERAADKRDTVILFVKNTKKYLADKVLLVYNDGVKGLVVELRNEGFLPADGKATIANAIEIAKAAPAAVRAKAKTLAAELIELIQKAPELAREKYADLVTMVLAAKDTALEKATSAKEYILERAPEYYAQLRDYALEQANKFKQLVQNAPELAQQKAQELYTWFLGMWEQLTPKAKEQLNRVVETVKALPATAQEAAIAKYGEASALVQEKFPESLEKVQASKAMALEYKECAVEKVLATKQTVTSKWESLAAKLKTKYENFSLEQFKTDMTALGVEYKELVMAKALAKKEEVTSYVAEFKLEEKAADVKEVALAKAAQFKGASVEVKTQVMAYIAQLLALLKAKLGQSKEIEEAESIKDPFDDKFEQYCKENNLDDTSDQEESDEGEKFKAYYGSVSVAEDEEGEVM